MPHIPSLISSLRVSKIPLLFFIILFLSCEEAGDIEIDDDVIKTEQLIGSWEIDSLYDEETASSRDFYFVYSNVDFWGFRIYEVDESESGNPEYLHKFETVVVYNLPQEDTISYYTYVYLDDNRINYLDPDLPDPRLPSDLIHSISDTLLTLRREQNHTRTYWRKIPDHKFVNFLTE
jgi:hypothetical protein